MIYRPPSILNFDLKNVAFTQSVSGETPLIPLDCEGSTAICDANSFGANCSCGTVNMTFLVPGADCDSVSGGNDCSITPVCTSPQFSSVQCSEGCVVTVTCSATCDNVDFTASCPGYETCATNAGSDNC
jgi:hypothetical protein